MTSSTRRLPPVTLLLAIPHLGGGGAERVVAQLARHLDPLRFEVHLATLTQDFPGAEVLPSWVEVHRLGCARVRHAAPALLRLTRCLRPDVIVSGMAHLNFLILLLKPLLGRQTRVLVRQNTTASLASTGWVTRLGYRYLYPRADGVICQSRAMADDLAERFGLARDRLVVLANPIDMPANPVASANPNPDWPAEAWPRLLAAGRLSREKGVDLLVRAMPRILRQFPNAHAMVLGAGPEDGALRQLAAELHLEGAITLAGHRDNVAQAFAESTLFVQPSRYEGMPNALLEAAAAGLPLVATPSSGGVCNLLRDAPGAWITTSITPESLGKTILEALDSLNLINPERKIAPRIEHAFLAPFRTETAVAAYATYLEGFQAAPGPFHLAMLIPTIDAVGGAERQAILLATEMAARGHRVTLIALSGSGVAARQELTQAGVAYLTLAMRKAWIDPRGWRSYLRWAKEHQPDILHCHLPHATWFGRWVRLLAPVRVQIDTLHSTQIGGWAGRTGYRLSNFLTSAVTCVSASVADAAARAGIGLRQRLSVVPNGVPLPAAETVLAANSERSAAGQPFRWIAVGRLSTVKDYPTLLCAFAALPEEPRLTIAGTGQEEAALRILAAELRLGERLRFAGFERNIAPLLAAADAFVLSSRWEGLPVAALEAAAAGLPVVATDGAGTREAVVVGESALLVPVGDAPALSHAMAAMMAMPADQRKSMGERGRLFVESGFSLSAVANRWQQLYASLLRSNPQPRRRG